MKTEKEIQNVKYTTIGGLRCAYVEGELCGKEIGKGLSSSKNIQELAEKYITSRQKQNSLDIDTADSFQEGFNVGYLSTTKNLPITKKIRLSLKAIIFGHYALKKNLELSKNMTDREYWNLK